MWVWIVICGILGALIGYYYAKQKTVRSLTGKEYFDTRMDRRTYGFMQASLRDQVALIAFAIVGSTAGMILGLMLMLVWKLVALIVHLVIEYR